MSPVHNNTILFQSAFETAVSLGDMRFFEKLIEQKDMEFIEVVDSVLKLAIDNFNPQIFRQVIEKYSERFTLNFPAYLQRSIEEGALGLIQYLVEEKKVSLTDPNLSFDPVKIAIEAQRYTPNPKVLEVLKYLCQQGCDIQSTINPPSLSSRPHSAPLSVYANLAAFFNSLGSLNVVLQDTENQKLFFTSQNLKQTVHPQKFAYWIKEEQEAVVEFFNLLEAHNPSIYQTFYETQKDCSTIDPLYQEAHQAFFEKQFLEKNLKSVSLGNVALHLGSHIHKI